MINQTRSIMLCGILVVARAAAGTEGTVLDLMQPRHRGCRDVGDCAARTSRDSRRRLGPGARDARFGTRPPSSTAKRALLATRCIRENCCSRVRPIHASRTPALNAPACQPGSASHVSPRTATCRHYLPNRPRYGR